MAGKSMPLKLTGAFTIDTLWNLECRDLHVTFMEKLLNFFSKYKKQYQNADTWLDVSWPDLLENWQIMKWILSIFRKLCNFFESWNWDKVWKQRVTPLQAVVYAFMNIAPPSSYTWATLFDDFAQKPKNGTKFA